MLKHNYCAHDADRMCKALLNTKAILDGIQNGTIELCDDSMEVFDPVNHRYCITTVLACIRNNTYAALGVDLPHVRDWYSQFPITRQAAAEGNTFAPSVTTPQILPFIRRS